MLGRSFRDNSSARAVVAEIFNSSSRDNNKNKSSAPSWLLDYGASHHLTNDKANLQDTTPYLGHENVTVGNGSLLIITHVGTSTIALDSCSLILSHVLHTLTLSYNLLFVQKLCPDINKIV